MLQTKRESRTLFFALMQRTEQQSGSAAFQHHTGLCMGPQALHASLMIACMSWEEGTLIALTLIQEQLFG